MYTLQLKIHSPPRYNPPEPSPIFQSLLYQSTISSLQSRIKSSSKKTKQKSSQLQFLQLQTKQLQKSIQTSRCKTYQYHINLIKQFNNKINKIQGQELRKRKIYVRETWEENKRKSVRLAKLNNEAHRAKTRLKSQRQQKTKQYQNKLQKCIRKQQAFYTKYKLQTQAQTRHAISKQHSMNLKQRNTKIQQTNSQRVHNSLRWKMDNQKKIINLYQNFFKEVE